MRREPRAKIFSWSPRGLKAGLWDSSANVMESVNGNDDDG